MCAALFSAVLYSSCTNKCGSTTCQNGGTCTNNKCVCPTGYSGNSCQTAWSDEFIGTYNCSRSTCSPSVAGVNSWQSAITKSSTNGGYTIAISNFDNSNTTQTATVDSVGGLRIAPVAGSYGVSATGNWASSAITIYFTTYVSGGTGYHCTMTLVKE
jgi:hypothetical protein